MHSWDASLQNSLMDSIQGIIRIEDLIYLVTSKKKAYPSQ